MKNLMIVVPFSGTYGNPSFELDWHDGAVRFDEPLKTVLERFAKEYVRAWNNEFKYETDIDLGLEYESVEMPREYNFATDRIFARIPKTGWRKLVQCIILCRDHKQTMTRVSIKRHTSRDGFFSFYDPDWESWGPVLGWDHNQLETLLLAVMEIKGISEYKMECEVMGNSSVLEAIDSHLIYEEDA
jgi:hypothetical protein